MTAGQRHTWDGRHAYHGLWVAAGDGIGPVTAVGIASQPCGCLLDTMASGEIWEPCMAHEGDGHLAAISEQDGLHVARCLVLACAWQETRMHETDAISAAQGHWRATRDS